MADPTDYEPRPIDTTGVTLSPEIVELTELLARSTHDHWAQQRFSQGWTHGPQRDDWHKQHPCLVPYERLPDAEKQYDRTTALESLKAILALGYQIIPPTARTAE
jgi:ryanodine receptor 2